VTDWADAKRDARAAVHAAFAVSARYLDPLLAAPVAITARWHAKGLTAAGDMGSEGFAEIVTRPDRLLFSREELTVAGVTLRHNGRVELTDYGIEVLVLDVEEPQDGPDRIVWTVSRASPGRGTFT
jgi:hypothetical protein